MATKFNIIIISGLFPIAIEVTTDNSGNFELKFGRDLFKEFYVKIIMRRAQIFLISMLSIDSQRNIIIVKLINMSTINYCDVEIEDISYKFA